MKWTLSSGTSGHNAAEQVVTLERNAWSQSSGMGGQIERNTHLRSIVQFYNTRDVYKCDAYPTFDEVTPALLDQGYIPGYPQNSPNGYCWPGAEVPGDTVNTAELGDLGLTSAEVDLIVAFMEGLTD